MDKNATNYNADAKEDDASCKYERDEFVGSWNAVDSVHTPFSTWTVQTRATVVSKHASEINKIIIDTIKIRF